MTIKEIISAIKPCQIINETDLTIDNFSTDTRTIKENDAYIGLKGETFDGSDFWQKAIENGSKLLILSKSYTQLKEYSIQNNTTTLIVNDTLIALGNLASYKRDKLNIPIIAITGSAGKTSTKDMVYSVLNEKFKVLKTQGNFNNQIGLPLTILGLKDEQILVLEMGMNHFGEISYLSKIAKPNVAIITNIGTAHIGNLGSRENILKAKLEILDGMQPNGTLIINNDNDLLHEWYLNNKENYKIITVGIENKSNIMPRNIIEKDSYSTYIFHDTLMNIPVGGRHFIYNSLLAVAVGTLYNLLPLQISKGLKKFELSGNRMKIIKNNNIIIIDDSYNANYDAVSSALKYLSEQKGRLIACLGTMRELGDYSKELHSKLGHDIVNDKIDYLITVGEYSEYINNTAIELGFDPKKSFHYDNNSEAINKINEIKKDGDFILVKASYLLHFNEIVEKIIH